MQRKISFSAGEYYHIYNRGIEKRKTFLETSDYLRFTKILRLANGSRPIIFKTIQGDSLDRIDLGKRLVAIGAYVLMPNHFHILIKELSNGGLTTFMKKLTTSYAMYFNKKYERVGALFQRPFRAEHVNSDEYLKYLFSYIHLNPIKILEPSWKETGIKDIRQAQAFINNYRYSSYFDYTNKQNRRSQILSPKEFPDYFEDRCAFINFHKEWVALKANYPRRLLG